MVHAFCIEPISQFTGDITGAIIRQQPGLVLNGNLIAARILQCQFQCIRDITGLHCSAQLPNDLVSREVIENGR